MWKIGPAVRADFRRLYPTNAKTPTCPSDDNRTKVTNSVTSARSLWWHVGPYFWPADLTRTANPIVLGHVFGILHNLSAPYLLSEIRRAADVHPYNTRSSQYNLVVPQRKSQDQKSVLYIAIKKLEKLTNSHKIYAAITAVKQFVKGHFFSNCM